MGFITNLIKIFGMFFKVKLLAIQDQESWHYCTNGVEKASVKKKQNMTQTYNMWPRKAFIAYEGR